MRETAPLEFREFATYADHGEIENTVFVAHVPEALLSIRTYRLANGETGADGRMFPGELGLFGINAIDQFPHPTGDGIIIVGSCV